MYRNDCPAPPMVEGWGRTVGAKRDGVPGLCAFGEDVNGHTGFFVGQLWPTPGLQGQCLKPRDRRRSQEIGDIRRAQNDINILSDPANVAVTPDRPSASDDRLAMQSIQQTIHRLDHAAITSGKILGFEACDPSQPAIRRRVAIVPSDPGWRSCSSGHHTFVFNRSVFSTGGRPIG